MTAYRTLITGEDLKVLLDSGTVRLFDCTFDLLDAEAGRRAYDHGHIPGATYLHLDHDLSSAPSGDNGRHPLPDPQAFAAMLRAQGLHQGQQVVAYDRSGGPYAARLWWLLRWLGHDAVAVLDGGLDAWVAAGGALESGDAGQGAAGDFDAKVQEAATVSAQDLVDALGSDLYTIIDARSPDRFAGEPHPFDPVAGHIPGARNRFFQHNLDGQGRWKSPEALASDFASVIAEGEPGTIVLQCGSGVTACHNALALAHAGRTDWRLYPGSWSEWIADPHRPVERLGEA